MKNKHQTIEPTIVKIKGTPRQKRKFIKAIKKLNKSQITILGQPKYSRGRVNSKLNSPKPSLTKLEDKNGNIRRR